MSVQSTFSEADLEAVRDATRAAEANTAGELVCVIVGRSDTYEGARWKAATFGALTGTLLASYGLYAFEVWSASLFVWAGMLPFAVAAACWLIVTGVPTIHRELVGHAIIQQRVHQRAAAAFVAEEVFQTRDRTGVLIFLSLFERRVEILCDEGIRASVPAEAWKEIVSELAAGLHDERAVTALVAAVEACGRLLAEHGVAPRSDDSNELSDLPRLDDA